MPSENLESPPFYVGIGTTGWCVVFGGVVVGFVWGVFFSFPTWLLFPTKTAEQVECRHFSEKSVLHVWEHLAVVGSGVQRPWRVLAGVEMAVPWLSFQQDALMLSLGVTWGKCLARWMSAQGRTSVLVSSGSHIPPVHPTSFSLLPADLFTFMWDRATGEVRVDLRVLLCSRLFWYSLV